MSTVGGVQEVGGCSSRSQCRCDLASDQTGFTNSGHNDPPRRPGNGLYGAREIVSDALLGFGQRVGLHAQDATATLYDVFARHWLMRDQISTARLIRSSSAESGSMFGPSLGAVSGVGWVSINSACAPAAIAESARRGTNSRAPPLEPSGP